MVFTAEKRKGIVVQLLAYAAATFAAFLAGSSFHLWHPLAKVAVADFTGTCVIFLFSRCFNNSSLYDPYWSVKPIVLAVYFFALSPDSALPRSLVVAILMILYGARLTANFFHDWPGLQREDWRYRYFRMRFPRTYWLVSFFGIHLLPSVLVYAACVPAYFSMTTPGADFGPVDFLAAIVFLSSIGLSFEADRQMRSFRNNPENEGKIMDRGLWSISRHPNYLGEVLGWWGLWLFAVAADWRFWWTGVGALGITLLFLFVSIPMMDRRSSQKRQDFHRYKATTPVLFPSVRKRTHLER